MKTVVSELVRVKNIKNIIYLAALFALVGCNENNRNTDAGTESLNSDPQSVADTLQSAYTDSADTKMTGTGDTLITYTQKREQTTEKELADLSRRTVTKYFANRDSDTLSVGTARLAVPSGSMNEPRVLSITPLRKSELAQLPAGMVNVTGHCGAKVSDNDTIAGYRFLPHGNHFSHHMASITMPYDSTLIPKGYTAADIHTYYYDEKNHQWTMLRHVSTDSILATVTAQTSHFTDVINGIIKVPESPETSNYVPTGISDLKAADPSAGIHQIEAPSANQNGTASLSYPFETPGGRGGISAGAGLQYSSEGGSSFVGFGWSLPVQSIDIETRWGVPRFDSEKESESYLLAGRQLNDR